MSDLVGNPEDRFSHNEAQVIKITRVPCIFVIDPSRTYSLLPLVTEICSAPATSVNVIFKSAGGLGTFQLFLVLSSVGSENQGVSVSFQNGGQLLQRYVSFCYGMYFVSFLYATPCYVHLMVLVTIPDSFRSSKQTNKQTNGIWIACKIESYGVFYYAP